MKASLLLGLLLITTLNYSCKKGDGDAEDDGVTTVVTLEALHSPANGVYGEKYTFMLRFDAIGDIKEYGIVYKPWIQDKSNKIPTVGDSESFKIPFGTSPSQVGIPESQEMTLRYADFNDANYRAYAVTESGAIMYGEVIYISFA